MDRAHVDGQARLVEPHRHQDSAFRGFASFAAHPSRNHRCRRPDDQYRLGGPELGVDLVKDPALLHAAYNDAAGVTAAFNRNLLRRANRELGTPFEPERFAHYAFYAPRQQRIEMHLVSLGEQPIDWEGRRYVFADGESIHTENSYKYSVDGFRALAQSAGFEPRALWCDAQRLFSLHWLVAP